ncbi:MAG TPA: polysaccharide pyruvyl transferase CsaB [Desulfotomaculum sp.]|nr:polysaccharide pyruvyl transferase CsaB [Desulfotomaculum sp.]
MKKHLITNNQHYSTLKLPAAPRLVISGYYGFDNIGDEAVLLSMVAALRDICPEARITVLSNKPRETAEHYDVQAVNRWQLTRVYRALAGTDLLISGGGSLLQDVTGLKSLLYYLGVVWLALKLGKPVAFYSQGIGPVTSRMGRCLMRRIAGRVNLITVRDAQSARDLHEMGITGPPVRVTADPVLGLSGETINPQPGGELLFKAGIKISHNSKAGLHLDPEDMMLDKYALKQEHRPVAGISLREWPGFEKKSQQVIAGLGDELCRQGWQVVFLPFHYPADLAVCRQVAGLMKNPGIILEQKVNSVEMASVISHLNLLIAMRLHALILAAVASVPLAGISYDPKINRFLEQLGLAPVGKAAHLDYPACLAAVTNILADPDGFRTNLRQAIQPLRRQAQETAALTLNLIRNDS